MANTRQDHDVRIERANVNTGGALSARGIRSRWMQAPSVCTRVEGAVLCVVALFFAVTSVGELYRDATMMTGGANPTLRLPPDLGGQEFQAVS